MKTLSRVGLIVLGCAVTVATVVVWCSHLRCAAGAPSVVDRFSKEGAAATVATVEARKGLVELPSFAELVKRSTPAVVNISFEKTVSFSWGGRPPFGRNDPFDDFFGRFFGEMPREFKNKGLGSGFITSPDGFIVTNNHVVEQADKVTVKLMDDEKEYDAKVVGRDEKTDVALIKIDVKKQLPVLPLGDSEKIQIGDWVVAIGNPLGLSHTVTKGIVSFKGRREVQPGGPGGYYDFIQTDAPINPGNSGGPLLDLNGAVIGVNESIISGAQNIGFAVPINMVKTVLPSLREHGKVIRAWLGVEIQPVSRELADSFNLKKVEGALIADVVPGGPAEKAGLKQGDVIVEFNGKAVGKSSELPWAVSNAGVGTEARVKVMREGKSKEFTIVLGELPETAGLGGRVSIGKDEGVGLSIRPVPSDLASKLRMHSGKGVLVDSVAKDSRAGAAGVQEGDVVLMVNDRETNSTDGFVKAVKEVKKGAIIRLLIRRNEGTIFVAFTK